jgi:hypothetical protein
VKEGGGQGRNHLLNFAGQNFHVAKIAIGIKGQDQRLLYSSAGRRWELVGTLAGLLVGRSWLDVA